MRHALSLLTGTLVALVCVLFLHQASSLSVFALAGCGLGICLVTRTWAYNLPALRRAGVRLRIFWRRHGAEVLPRHTAPVPFVRRHLGRVNAMWLSYSLIVGWAAYEILDGTRFIGHAPIERAAAGASSAMDAVAGTSAAIRALSTVPQRDLDVSGNLRSFSAPALPVGADSEALLPEPPVKEF